MSCSRPPRAVACAAAPCLAARIGCAGHETNAFFVTAEGYPIYQEKIEAASRAPECRPVELDPEGHWGPITEGFQLSLRFTNTVVHVGEPLIATIILRNVSPTNLFNSVWGRDTQYTMVITDSSGQPLLGAEWRGGSRFPGVLDKGTQLKVESNLTLRYPFTRPGTYSVYAMRRAILKLDGSGHTEIVSGKVSFTILPAPPGH